VAFGLGLLTDLTPPGAWEAQPLTDPIVRVRSATPAEIARSWSGIERIGWQGTIDGAPFAVEQGNAGDHRFVHGAHPAADGTPSPGTRAIHHLSRDGGLLQCAPADIQEPSWWRAVLDSVLFTVALLHGYEALHAASVATPQDGAIAIAASTGGGKSTLLSELLRRGLALMADDVLVLEPRGRTAPPLAHPAPPLMTLPAQRLSSLAGAGEATRSEVPEASAPQAICSLGDERWIAVPAHPASLALRTLVVLERRPGAPLSLSPIDDPLAALMSSLMSFPRTPARERARLELASTLAATTRLLRLSADPSTPAELLADVLLHGLASIGGGGRSASGRPPHTYTAPAAVVRQS
jgi:hypothetical protein